MKIRSKRVAFLAFVGFLFLGCADDHEEAVRVPEFVLANYGNIHLERIPFANSPHANTTRYGADQGANATSVVFSMPRRAGFNNSSPPKTSFYTIVDNRGGGASNFNAIEFRWDVEAVNRHIDIKIEANHRDNVIQELLTSIEGQRVLNNLPFTTPTNFSLTAGVRGEPVDNFPKIIGGSLVLYDWKHIRFYVDMENSSGGSHFQNYVNRIAEDANYVFRQAAVHVTMVNRKEDANVVLRFSRTNSHQLSFVVSGDTVTVNNHTSDGSIPAIATIAMAIRFGLEQNHSLDTYNLMHPNNVIQISSFTVLNRRQWDILNSRVPQ